MGSLPRALGRGRAARGHGVLQRFTPTCVGTRRKSHPWLGYGSVHPHVRGDEPRRSDENAGNLGSPPRAWGRARVGRRPERGARFTPTCVGTRRRWRAGRRAAPVHPHVRGDERWTRAVESMSSGSPPRAWGREPPQPRRRRPTRFTPPCVGTRRRCAGTLCRRTVHPHVRGDERSGSASSRLVLGSPPRAWGRVPMHALALKQYRFTPTCVGTSRWSP